MQETVYSYYLGISVNFDNLLLRSIQASDHQNKRQIITDNQRPKKKNKKKYSDKDHIIYGDLEKTRHLIKNFCAYNK